LKSPIVKREKKKEGEKRVNTNKMKDCYRNIRGIIKRAAFLSDIKLRELRFPTRCKEVISAPTVDSRG